MTRPRKMMLEELPRRNYSITRNMPHAVTSIQSKILLDGFSFSEDF